MTQGNGNNTGKTVDPYMFSKMKGDPMSGAAQLGREMLQMSMYRAEKMAKKTEEFNVTDTQ